MINGELTQSYVAGSCRDAVQAFACREYAEASGKYDINCVIRRTGEMGEGEYGRVFFSEKSSIYFCLTE
jgi:hypothetical protein